MYYSEKDVPRLHHIVKNVHGTRMLSACYPKVYAWYNFTLQNTLEANSFTGDDIHID